MCASLSLRGEFSVIFVCHWNCCLLLVQMEIPQDIEAQKVCMYIINICIYIYAEAEIVQIIMLYLFLKMKKS